MKILQEEILNTLSVGKCIFAQIKIKFDLHVLEKSPFIDPMLQLLIWINYFHNAILMQR